MGYKEMEKVVKSTKLNNGVYHLWKTIFTKGYIEMPSKEHFE